MVLAGIISAQSALNWENLGPDNLGSPTRAMAYLADGRLLAGSQGGGLWYTSNEGGSWKRLETYNGNPNVSSIVVSGQTIYVATGATGFNPSPYSLTNSNYDFRNQPEGYTGYLKSLPGSGVWISKDGGVTWSNSNATTQPVFGTLNYKGPFVSIQKIQKVGNRIFIGTLEGLYYSDDDLASVQKSQGSARFLSSIVYDVESSGSVIFAGTNVDSLYISNDNGSTFSAALNSVFFDNGRFNDQRVEIAIAPSDDQVVYVGTVAPSGSLKGLYRSDDRGTSWRTYAPPGASGFLPLVTSGREAFVIAVFPDNADEIILAGDAWYTYTNTRGWTQTAQHSSTGSRTYIPTRIYTVLFTPGSSTSFWIGTERQPTRSIDRGATFSRHAKGYAATLTYSVASYKNSDRDAVVAGTPANGIIYNGHFSDPNSLVRQGFGAISTRNSSELQVSFIRPGGMIAQGTDGGPRRSLNGGEVLETFYGFPILPQVRNLGPVTRDTIIDRDREGLEGSGLLNQVGVSGPRILPAVLDEYIPDEIINNPNLTPDQIEAATKSYLFFASANYVWITNNTFGDLLDIKMNRVSRQLVTAPEYITALAVSGDTNHIVWVGTSAGKLYRLNNPTRLSGFDALNDMTQVNTLPSSNLLGMTGRWISSIAVDPLNPNNLAITYAGYGGNINATQSFVWYSANAMASAPSFGVLSGAPKEPMYATRFVVDPAVSSSVLLVGSESGLFLVKDIAAVGPGVPLFLSTWNNELGSQMGKIPVYDIFVRRFSSIVIDAETRAYQIKPDNTVFVATHGNGIWSTSSLTYPRLPGEELVGLPEAFHAFVAPNPTQPENFGIGLDLPEAAQVSYDLVGMDGRVVARGVIAKDPGFHRLMVEGNFAPGLYLVHLSVVGDSKTYTQTLKAVVNP